MADDAPLKITVHPVGKDLQAPLQPSLATAPEPASTPAKEDWSAFNPHDEPTVAGKPMEGPAPAQGAPSIAPPAAQEPAPPTKAAPAPAVPAEDWSAFNPHVDYGDLPTIPPAFQKRLQQGQSIGQQLVDTGSASSALSAIWEAAKSGAKAAYDADGLRKMYGQQRQEINNFIGKNGDQFGGWALIEQGVEAAENFTHVLSAAATGTLSGAGEAVGQALGKTGIGKAVEEGLVTPYSPDIPSVSSLMGQTLAGAIAPAIVSRNGKFARVVHDPDTGVTHAQVVGRMPQPQDFKDTAERMNAANPVPGGSAVTVEHKLKKQWDLYGIHPLEAEAEAQRSPARARDLSAAQSPVVPLTPRAAKNFVKDVDDRLYRLRTAHVADMAEFMELLKKLPSEFKDPEVQERIYKFMEGDPEISLTPKEGDLFNKHLVPLLEEQRDLYERLKDTDLDVKDYDPGYVHRLVKGKTPAIDRLAGEAGQANPIFNRPVGGLFARSTSSLQSRSYFAIQDEVGERHLVRMSNDGKSLTSAEKGFNLPPSNGSEGPLRLGDKINTGPREWTLVHARTAEIEEHTPLRYYQNGLLSVIDNLTHLRAADRAVHTIQQIRDSDEFNQMSTRGGMRGNENWKSPQMPLFKNDVMDPRLANTIDDFYGKVDTSDVATLAEKINNIAIGSLFWTPVPHAMNAGAHWFVARGWDNFTPPGIARLMATGAKAIHQVVTQGPEYRRLLRDGNALIYGGVANKDFLENTLKQVGVAIEKHPEGWAKLAEVTGIAPVSNLVNAFYQASARVLWATSDVFMMQRVLELEQKGLSTREAIAHTELHIPNYRIPAEIMGSRAIRQGYANPFFFEFSKYHYGIVKSYAHLAKDLAVGSGQQKLDAIGSILALGVLQMAIWPALSHLWQAATGEKDMSVPSFGPGRLASVPAAALVRSFPDAFPQMVKDYYGPQNKTFMQAVYNLFPFSPGAQTIIGAATGRYEYNGRPIVEPSDWRHGRYGRVAGQVGEFGVRTMVEPYNMFADAWKYGETPSTVVIKNVLGLQEDTPEKLAARARALKFQDREAKSRHKKPVGPIESLTK